MTIYSRGLLIGRFQPFHKGHLFLLHHVRKKVKKLVIAIGSANVIDEDNPFTYEERKKMIEKVVQEEKLTDFVVRIVPLNDYHNDELWYKQAIQKAVKVDLIIGNNEWTNSIFEKRGHAILRAGFFKRYLYEGEKIRNLIRQKKPWKERVPKYLVNMIKSYKLQTKSYKYHHVAIGGTFDHFHTGHKKLIDTALQYGRIISVGITSESMYKFKNFAESIESFQKRKKSLITYLKEKKSLNRVKFFQLSNIYGSASTDGTMEAIIVSKSTYPNAIRINTLRKENKLPELKIICIKD
ncbi:pantetheine-phosphate adenylyltransferase, partial [Candidatus Roizmanbacteria bacterium]|nr:pantetheine-phosphate adenylyltransferase [Candidatus Roizmanbacteria bacterium]